MSKKPSSRMRRAGEANESVERILDLTNQIGADLNKVPGGMENAVRMRRGITPVWPMALERRVGFDAAATLLDRAASYAVVDLWRREGRVAYDVHPEMANSLYRSNLKGKLPGRIFSRLGHISPLIPLPHPWPVNFGSGVTGLIRAYFLTGRVGRAFCPTTDDRSEGLCIVPWIDSNPETPTYHDILTPVFPLPALDESFTLADMVNKSFEWHGVGERGEGIEKITKQILPGALTLLTYLCCKNADIEEPSSPTRGRRRQAPSRDPYYVRVGWYVGPKLHAARSRASGRIREGLSVPSGVEYGPQHRVGHVKTVWVGPGRKRDESVWVDPYWTKLESLDEGQDPVTQVVPVDPQEKDPAGHRDVKLANLGRQRAKEVQEREAQRRREEGWDW
ncbi:hypothetical protein [Streptomyces cucumeris]|uniref:hypothetical protein n=1 Tax=Streptomyces cucumeris TaxID=2962890 RepID=UPI0020C8F392|nr:hypothetical protein [Streptomyces sp. NEAU-Y11]MCP9209666.1 hypothetical protein [Streptomyces sp. NEAU-Y11]